MKRIICAVLIFSCCFCQCGCKKKEKTNDKINPAFFSEETLGNWCKEQDFVAWDDIIDTTEFYKMAESNIDPRTGYMSNAVLDEWISNTVGDSMLNKYYPYNIEGTLFFCQIQDADSLHYAMPDVLGKFLEPTWQGLCVEIWLTKDFKLNDKKWNSMEEYLKYSGLSNYNDAEIIEISEVLFARYVIDKNPYDGSSAYKVSLSCFDASTGSCVIIEYRMPLEDNEEETQELRDLGIPVITDFIK